MFALLVAAFVGLFLLVAPVRATTTGIASYYDDGPGLYAAVPSYTFGDRRYPLTVCLRDDPSRCVTVTVRDHCNCYVGTPDERLIDLSPAAFAQLAPLSKGLIYVSTSRSAVTLTPPPTDTSPVATRRSLRPL